MDALFKVGSVNFSIADNNRKEVLGEAKGARKIAVRLYYPIKQECAEGKKKAEYVSKRKLEAMRKAFHIPRSALMKNEADYYEGADFAEGTFPLLLFSHGYNSFVEANTILCSDIAANGYVVASVGHAYEAIENDYDDGSCDYFDKSINKKMYKKGAFKAIRAQSKTLKFKGSIEEADEKFRKFQEEHTPFLLERIEEWRLDMLCALNAVKEKFGQHIDFSNGVAASGHSLGGAVAYYLCQTCDEVVCGLNIDGALFGDYRNMIMKKPFYQISCKKNWNVESSVLLRRESEVHTAIFSNMKHLGFTDMKFFIPMKMLVGTLPPDVMYSHLLKCHLTFLNKYLKHINTEINQSENPDVVIKTYS